MGKYQTPKGLFKVESFCRLSGGSLDLTNLEQRALNEFEEGIESIAVDRKIRYQYDVKGEKIEEWIKDSTDLPLPISVTFDEHNPRDHTHIRFLANISLKEIKMKTGIKQEIQGGYPLYIKPGVFSFLVTH